MVTITTFPSGVSSAILRRGATPHAEGWATAPASNQGSGPAPVLQSADLGIRRLARPRVGTRFSLTGRSMQSELVDPVGSHLRTCVHEAGHAVASLYQKVGFVEVRMVAAPDGIGWKGHLKPFKLDREVTVQDYEDKIVITWAGPLAEHLFCGAYSHSGGIGEGGDFNALWRLCQDLGVKDPCDWLDPVVDILVRRWNGVLALTRVLESRGSISGSQARQLYDKSIKQPKVMPPYLHLLTGKRPPPGPLPYGPGIRFRAPTLEDWAILAESTSLDDYIRRKGSASG